MSAASQEEGGSSKERATILVPLRLPRDLRDRLALAASARSQGLSPYIADVLRNRAEAPMPAIAALGRIIAVAEEQRRRSNLDDDAIRRLEALVAMLCTAAREELRL